MLDYIEERLHQPITLQGLARVGRYSPYHAARMFKELTGKSPFEYIRLRRLTAAAQALHAGAVRVVDVAFDFVFDSHEGFTRAFARQFGMTPSRFRADRPAVPLFLPVRMDGRCRNHQPGEDSMTQESRTDVVFAQILERPERKLILRRGRHASHYFEYCDEVGCDVWAELAAIEDALHEPMGLWLPDALRPTGTSSYVQGVEVDVAYAGAVPQGFDVITLPPCRMMVFQGPRFEDDDFERAIASVRAAIDSYQPERVGYAWADEDGPRFQLQPEGYRGYIEGRPVRPVN